MNATTVIEPADTATLRHAMVASQLRTNAVSDPRVVAVMSTVPRERYLPDTAPSLAYRDTLVAIGRGRMANLPMATGRLLSEAYLTPGDRVLLIGAAGGYAAAVLARLVAQVVAVESDPTLAASARAALANDPAASNVEVVEGTLADGHPEGAPYDVLIVDGAIDRLPDALADQVAIGGRIVTGIVDHGVTRLASGKRTAGGVGLADFVDIECVVLPGFAAPARFRF